MRTVLNVVWLVFGGLWMALFYVLAGVVCYATIIGIPFGVACFRIADYCLWPFGRTIVPRTGAGAGSVVGNVLWFLLAGWWLALGHITAGLLYCVTVIGIPLGVASFKLVPISLLPMGVRIVPTGG